MSSVLRYFACECGHIFNKIVPKDMSGLEPTSRTGVYRVVIGAKSEPEKTPCEKCGKVVECSDDPAGKAHSFRFNYMED